ncbi:GNAT family N-acetyltransferase [Pikeienuella piscinae]|uniref:L-ornithine N(alpha)-acyltransferase n=1 Tax=Pikeienuella piscinae TaxID=2748098 RepID=A0A7L5BTF5_9RHOB|nr:GNAT family N-acetyltransferase [Pikeienuella piscinae]
MQERTLRIDAGRFTVRLAESDEDVAAAQRLRYRVFVEEMGATPSPDDRALRRERDAFDPYFDHLLLIDNHAKPADPLDGVAGVYRLLRGDVAKQGCGFYGESEYDLTKIKEYPRGTVELGRSCVDIAHRGGAAMHLLWTGLGRYVAEHSIEIMFGVASFHGSDPTKLAMPLAYLHHNHLAPEDLRVRTREEFFVPMDLIPADQVVRAEAMRQIPPLIKAYIRLGGSVGEGAYVDHAFNTVDVCLLMDTSRMVDRYREFYQRASRGATDRILG